jgi:hypothetical protein
MDIWFAIGITFWVFAVVTVSFWNCGAISFLKEKVVELEVRITILEVKLMVLELKKDELPF